MPSTPRSQKWTNALLGVGFLAVVWLPLSTRLLGIEDGNETAENRKPHAPPAFSFQVAALQEFPLAFEAYFQDTFGLRQALIQAHHRIKVEWLKTSPNGNVVLGRDGWLFFTAFPLGEDANALRPFTQGELEQWQHLLQVRHDWLASRGMRYLFVIAPDKQTIYPEHYPGTLRARQRGPSRLDQLKEHLSAHSTVRMLDLRPALVAAKEREQLYYRTDTHWNALGARVAYREILTSLAAWFPGLRPLADACIEIDWSPGLTDLSGILQLPHRMSEEKGWCRPTAARSRKTEEVPPLSDESYKLGHMQASAFETPDPSLPRAVFIHDSFGQPLQPILPEHFRRLVCLPSYVLDARAIARERPDVVIQLIVERQLQIPAPEDPPELRN